MTSSSSSPYSSALNPDPRIKGFLDANKKWVESASYKAPILFLDMQRGGRERVDGTVIVVACTDPRVSPEQFLGMDLQAGSSTATIVRVAGGRVRSAFSTLLVLSAVGTEGKRGTIIVIHHTDCGLCFITDEEIKDSLRRRASGPEESAGVEGMAFGSIADPEQTVREDVGFLRDSSFFKGMQIVGLLQDTETGVLSEVVVK